MDGNNDNSAMAGLRASLANETQSLEAAQKANKSRSPTAQVNFDSEIDEFLAMRVIRINNFMKWRKPQEAAVYLEDAFNVVAVIRTPSIRKSALQGVAQVYNQDREAFLVEAKRMNLDLG